MTMFRRILFFAVACGVIPTNPASKMAMSGNQPRQQKWEDENAADGIMTAGAVTDAPMAREGCGLDNRPGPASTI